MDNKKQDSMLTFKSGIYNTIANIISMLVGVVLIPMLSRVLPANQLGIAVSFLTVRNLCVYLFTMAVYAAMHRAMLDFREKKHEFNSSVLIFGILSTFLFFLISLPFKVFFEDILNFEGFLLNWLFISVVFMFARIIMTNYLTFHNKYKSIFFIIILSSPVSQILSIIFVSMLNENLYIGRILGIDSLSAILGLIFIPVILYRGKCKFEFKYIKYALLITLPLLPHLVSQVILTQSDILLIRYFVGDEKTGIYSMAYTIGSLLYVVLAQIMMVWSPWVYRRLGEKDILSIRKNSRYMLVLGFFLSLGILTFSPEIIGFFLDKSYQDAIFIIPAIVVGMYFQFLYIFFYDVEYYHKKTKYISMSSLIAAILVIFLNTITIPKFGYAMAAYTTAGGYMTLAICHYLFMKIIDKRDIYDIKFIILISVMVIILAFIMLILVKKIFLRYLIFAIIMIFCIYKLKGEVINLKGRAEIKIDNKFF